MGALQLINDNQNGNKYNNNEDDQTKDSNDETECIDVFRIRKSQLQLGLVQLNKQATDVMFMSNDETDG